MMKSKYLVPIIWNIKYFFFTSLPKNMPKLKKARFSNSILKRKEKIEQKAVSKQPTTKSTIKPNNKSQIKEQTNEFISLTTGDKVVVKDFLIIAGSYERILYGIDAHWINSGEGSDDVYILFCFFVFFESDQF